LGIFSSYGRIAPILFMQTRLFIFCLGLFLLAAVHSPCADTTYVRLSTNLGYIDVLLYSDEAPNAVNNFNTLIAASGMAGYSNTIIHRAVINPATSTTPATPFVIQGGIFYDTYVTTGTGATETMYLPTITPARDYTTAPLNTDTTNPEYINANISNTRGTIAMALSSGENSGTTSWFFNEGDNSFLDTGDGGPFTVFGKIINTSSLSVMDQIGNLPEYNVDVASNGSGGLETTPLTSNQGVALNGTIYAALTDYVTVYSITPLTVQTFADWQTTKFTMAQQAMPAFIAPAATPLHDGVTNLLKYVCDINPSGPMTAASRAKLPTVGKTTIAGTPYMTLTYHQHNALLGVTVNVQTSPDLQNWTTVVYPNATFVQTGTDSAGDPIEQVRVPVSGTRQFIRLNVTQP
jgi:peptidyl-prolyl cis-trans isomerase A (cyclophilin A)